MAKDINPSYEPGPDDDEAGDRVVAPSNNPLSGEEGSGESPDTKASEELGDVDKVQGELEDAADEGDPVPEDAPPDSEDASPPDGGEDSEAPPEDDLPKFDFLPAPTKTPGSLGSDLPPAGSLDVEAGAEAPAPSEEEIGGIQKDLEGFGDQLNQFNEAGGADAFSAPGQENESGFDGPMNNFAEATVSYAKAANDFLTDHARSLNELQRRLEGERL